ncbi:peptidase domain-containing ABC transporter [Magnetospirillum fulvum]|uniref:ABC-type protease/lipase transport system, ATPase and permease component n=1 Tax=Magnetospirillum fulvum MGU-K5 TaxID=1316936 RepID=S9S8E5_MAGFU|nr:ATP-binding cassette domain-containing protein [Magnetospirillum fulvum]EPY00949.1 ABC-type protease/lipase transport system, ATPase and permease component [Magnetospirillum fulvum MGU-K5]
MMTEQHENWLKPILDPLRSVMRELLIASLFINLMALAVPIFVMQVYDRVIGHNGLSTLAGLTIGVALLLAFDWIIRTSRGRILQTMALRIDVDVGTRLFDKITRLPLRTLESRPTSFWQTLFRDVDTLRNTVSGATAILLTDLPFVFIFLGVIFVIGQPLALVFVLLLAAFAILAWASGRSVSEASGQEKNAQAGRDALVAEIIAGRATVKAVALDGALRPLWEERQAAAIEQSIRRGAAADGFVNLGQTLTMLGSVGLTTVGALYIIDHQLSMGALIACNMLSGRLYGPINQLVGAWKSFSAFRQSVDRLGDIFAETEERRDSAIRRERPTGRITLESVSFAYDPKLPPATRIERLEIRPGGLTAILGRNGSGKTTLLKILLGLYPPAEGRVLLDGADIAQFTRAELAGWIGYVPQECVLFNATIRDNIAYGAPGCDDEAILAAARTAGVHHYIVDLPDGYATPIGEAGSRLSAGQRQRIAIARALIGDPPVLLLDEPSASLDRQAEEELRATLAELGRSRTVVIVTHSPVLLPVCRDVVVLDKGTVTAAGPAAETLNRLFGPRPTAAPGGVHISVGGGV